MYSFDDYLRQNNIYVTLYDLPYSSHGFVLKHHDQYVIILNARISFIQQQKVFLHELAHCILNHFENNTELEEEEANLFMNIVWKVISHEENVSHYY